MKFLPFARLLRLPNVFTAFADILMGTLVAGSWALCPGACLCLLAASGCLYLGGMVWNDYFDFEEDNRERPFRPLPSGQISRRSAIAIGVALLGAGLFFAAIAGLARPGWSAWPFGIAVALVAAILAYDGGLKRTPFGPIAMGTCRLLNVLLALSLADFDAIPWLLRWHLALIVGIYIVGITWFARQEANKSQPLHLRGATGVMVLAIVLALALPLHRAPGQVTVAFPYLLVVFLAILAPAIVRALRKPESKQVQSAVKVAILGLIVFDGILATAFAGVWGATSLLLLPPALLLGKYVYST
jgi:4-hydroxybenzoate polyprenyltransferase